MFKSIRYLLIFYIIFLLFGCTAKDQNNLNSSQSKLTVGTVQQNIKKGMSSAEVISALGSPNLVTQDEKGNSVWVYDRASTTVQSNNSKAGLWLLIAAAGSSNRTTETSQSTLTIIIKFNNKNQVEHYTFRQSKF